jgi:hypothetical protein
MAETPPIACTHFEVGDASTVTLTSEGDGEAVLAVMFGGAVDF